MPTSLVLCVIGFVIIILAAIIILTLKSKGDPLTSYTPEQRKALHLQNKALTVWAVFLITGIFLYPFVEKVSPKLAAVYRASTYILMVGVAALLGISSIISEASILRHRGMRSSFPKGGLAVQNGVIILIFLGIALWLWLTEK